MEARIYGMNADAVARFRAAELSKYDLTYFRNEYWKEDLPGKRGNGARSYDDPDHAIRFDLLATALNQAVQFGNLLDVGCGPGLLLRALSHREIALEGVDAAPAAIALARDLELGEGTLGDRARLHNANCTALPFPNQSFDVVTCFDVLEHLPVFDVEAAIDEMIRVCRNHLILSVNSDNPYDYHPTILSPATWRAILGSRATILEDGDLEAKLTREVAARRDEYTFYCYSISERR